MATAVEVAKYIQSQTAVTGWVQLQKLVYFSQAWHLVWNGRPLFADRIEAWKMGPVTRAVWTRRPSGDASALAGQDAAATTVEAIVGYYGGMYGTELTSLTHSHSPWQVVWDSRGHSEQWSDAEIPHELMRRFYTEQALSGVGPQRPALVGEASDPVEWHQIGAAAAVRWRDALDLLGR